MALLINDVIEITFRGALFDQTILNTFHYRVIQTASIGDVFDDLLEIATDVANNAGGSLIESGYLACAGPQYTLNRVRAQRVSPTRSIYAEFLIGASGTHASPCTTANVAASIMRRTSRPGRRGVGRLQVAGVPANVIVSGGLDVVYQTTQLASMATRMKVDFTTTVNTILMRPCLFNPGFPAGPPYADLVDVLALDRLRTMHRRTLRLGI